jgi:hypothetical protein
MSENLQRRVIAGLLVPSGVILMSSPAKSQMLLAADISRDSKTIAKVFDGDVEAPVDRFHREHPDRVFLPATPFDRLAQAATHPAELAEFNVGNTGIPLTPTTDRLESPNVATFDDTYDLEVTALSQEVIVLLGGTDSSPHVTNQPLDVIPNYATYLESQSFSNSAIDLDSRALPLSEGNADRLAQVTDMPDESETASDVTDDNNVQFGDRFTIVPMAGSLGPGLHVATPLGRNSSLRLGFNSFPGLINFNADYDDINYELQLQLLSANLLLDYYPWGPDSAFRLTVGLMYQNIRFDGVAEAQGTVEIGENAYDLSDLGQLSGSVFFQNEFAPYVGIGIGNPNNAVRNRVSFFGELGLLFVGDIDASLTATNPSP